MGDSSTPLPDGDDLGRAPERPLLEGFLAYFRAVLARKAEGLTDAQARLRPCPPSDLSMLGLVRHMTDVERIWAEWTFAGQDNVPIYYGDAHPDGDMDGDFHPPDDATLADALAEYWSRIAIADGIYARAGLDDVQVGGRQEHTLRWILVHLIEEYARHCGHADLVRQAIDGATGD